MFYGCLCGLTTTQGLAFFSTYIGITVAIDTAVGDIIIPSSYNGMPVAAIVNIAFNIGGEFQPRQISSILIPNSVFLIHTGAFYGATNLTSITIPNSVTVVAHGAFNNTGIWNNTPDNSVVYADRWAVGFKGNLENVVLRDNTVAIGNSAFQNATSLTSITIPNSVTSIGDGAFVNATSLTTVTFEEGSQLTSIGDGVFSGATNLTSITIPVSVTSIGGWAFANATNLTSITIPNSVTSISSRAFEGWTNSQTIRIQTHTTRPTWWTPDWNTHSNAQVVWGVE